MGAPNFDPIEHARRELNKLTSEEKRLKQRIENDQSRLIVLPALKSPLEAIVKQSPQAK